MCAGDAVQHSVEHAENLTRRLEAFITTMDANDDKINNVVTFGRQLIADNNYAADKVQQKADSLQERWVPAVSEHLASRISVSFCCLLIHRISHLSCLRFAINCE